MGYRIVLTTDETLTSTYHNIPLLDFFGCAPYEKVPKIVYKILDTQIKHENGKLKFAPYGLRKVEAALLADGYREEEVVVAHPKFAEKFIAENTKIVGINTMDPMGIGPVSLIFTQGGRYTSFSEYKFVSLVNRINKLREKRNYKFKLVVGGQGAWELQVEDAERRKLRIDHLVIGETEHVIGELFRDIENGSLAETVEMKTWPQVDEIPTIVNPTYKGMVEVTRGCGRGCKFCAPNLRIARHSPLDKIKTEIDVNVNAGATCAWLHSEDIFMYQNEDRKNFYPNKDAIIKLFRLAATKVRYAGPTHGTAAGALAAPEVLKEVSDLFGNNGRKWIGIQVGFETASSSVIKKYSKNKAKPFSADEWPWILLNGTYMFNKYCWFPAYTTILGLPGSTEEDEIETAKLILTMEKELTEKLGNKAHFTVTPLAFVPVGTLKNESFFDIKNGLNKGMILHLYHAWRHLALEVKKSLSFIVSEKTSYFIFKPIARLGCSLIISTLRKWANRHGVDVDKKLDLLDLKIGC